MIARREAEKKAQEKVDIKMIVSHVRIICKMTGIFARDRITIASRKTKMFLQHFLKNGFQLAFSMFLCMFDLRFY